MSEISELRLAAGIATALRQDIKELLQAIPPSKRGSRVTKILETMTERMDAIELCVRDADRAARNEGDISQ